MVSEAYELLQISKFKRKGETDSEWALRRAKAVDEANTRLLTLFHALVQVEISQILSHILETAQSGVGVSFLVNEHLVNNLPREYQIQSIDM